MPWRGQRWGRLVVWCCVVLNQDLDTAVIAGAAAGAGAGVGTAAFSDGDNIVLPKGQLLEVKLDEPFQVPIVVTP